MDRGFVRCVSPESSFFCSIKASSPPEGSPGGKVRSFVDVGPGQAGSRSSLRSLSPREEVVSESLSVGSQGTARALFVPLGSAAGCALDPPVTGMRWRSHDQRLVGMPALPHGCGDHRCQGGRVGVLSCDEEGVIFVSVLVQTREFGVTAWISPSSSDSGLEGKHDTISLC